MSASMAKCQSLFRAIKLCNTSFQCRQYAIKPPQWMGGGHFIVEKEDDPTSDPTFEEIMKERNYIDPEIAKSVNIGEKFIPGQIRRKEWQKLRKENKSNAELEKQSRHQTLTVPLHEVKQSWMGENGPAHMKEIAEHYGIYRDLFNGAFFHPVQDMNVEYDYDDEFVSPVHFGNRLSPEEAGTVPHISFSAPDDSLYTLLMTNPDGHLQDNDQEYLHMLIGNIPGSDISSGDLVCDYLQPFPARGTGHQRFVFILFKQSKQIDFSAEKRPENCFDLGERTFKTIDFYRTHEDTLTPVGLKFFQAEWDRSVHDVFHKKLNMKDPEFEYFHPPAYHPRQKMYPKRQPFDRYFDRYRDRKDLGEEALKLKLSMVSPFKEYKPLQFPTAHEPYGKDYKPSWLKRKHNIMHRRLEQFKDLPK